MFVTAPTVSGSGESFGYTQTLPSVSGAGLPRTTHALAKAYLDNLTDSTVPQGHTTRQLLQDGHVGNGKYVDTAYSVEYTRHKPSRTPIRACYHNGTVVPAHWVGVQRNIAKGCFAADPGLIELDWRKTPGSTTATLNALLVSNLQNRCQVEARLKALDTNIDLAEALTGLPQTARLVAERVTQVLRAYVAVRGKHFQRAADILGLRRKWLSEPSNLANVWLEMSYGWLPLISDIFDGSEELVRLVQNKADKPFYTVTRRGGSGLFLRNMTNSLFPDWSSETEARATVEVKLRFSIANSFAAYMSQLRVSNPAYIGWTALPFSFVVDWLLPVGDMLSALNSNIGLDFHGGYMTTRTYGKRVVRASAFTYQSIPLVAFEGTATAETETLYMARQVFWTWPTVLPYLSIPLGSDKRIANAVSLIAASRKFH